MSEYFSVDAARGNEPLSEAAFQGRAFQPELEAEMGNARRRKAKNGSRHDINDQSQSQGERSIQGKCKYVVNGYKVVDIRLVITRIWMIDRPDSGPFRLSMCGSTQVSQESRSCQHNSNARACTHARRAEYTKSKRMSVGSVGGSNCQGQ